MESDVFVSLQLKCISPWDVYRLGRNKSLSKSNGKQANMGIWQALGYITIAKTFSNVVYVYHSNSISFLYLFFPKYVRNSTLVVTAIRALDGLCIDSNHHQNYSIPTYLHGSFLVDDIKVDVYQIKKKKKVKLNTIVILPTFSFSFSVPQNKVDWPDMYTLIDFPPVHMVYTLIKLAAILCVWLTIRHRLFMATTVCYNAVVIGKKLLAISSYNSRRHTHTYNSAVIALCEMDRHQWICPAFSPIV